jgi:hypothetical protein
MTLSILLVIGALIWGLTLVPVWAIILFVILLLVM